jgi:uncharacterized protein (TIGR02996 family)
MSTYDGFLAAIRDEPDSDEARLILADWLQDQDDPDCAEFIRVQCVLARLPEYHDVRAELEARERGLLLLHEKEWADLPTDQRVEGGYRRGFLARLRIPARLLLREPERFLGEGLIEELVVEFDDLPDIVRVVGLSQLRSVRRLHLIGDSLHRAGVEALIDAPHLQQLVGLTLRFRDISRPGLRRLIGGLPGLRDLDLGRCRLDPDDVAALLPTQPSALERLALDGNHFADDGTRTLAACSHLGQLRELSLHEVRMSTAGHDALLAAPFAAGLESLDLGSNPDLDGPPVLLTGTVFRSLRRLLLTNCSFDFDQPPGTSSSSPSLRQLVLGWSGFLPDGLAEWLNLPSLARLECLTLTTTARERLVVPGSLLDALTAAPSLGCLRRLALHAHLTAEDFARLLSGRHAGRWGSLEIRRANLAGGLAPLLAGRLQLSRLLLGPCELGDDDAIAIADCEWLSDLRELDLCHNYLGDASAEALARSPYLKRLASLDLSHNAIRAAEPFVGTYLANPAILNLELNPISSGQEELLQSGAEFMRRVTVAPILALLASAEASP